MFRSLTAIFSLFFLLQPFNLLQADDSSSGSGRLPFNQRAYESKKKGWPVFEHRSIEVAQRPRDLKILPLWSGTVRFPQESEHLHAQTTYGWATRYFDHQGRSQDASYAILDGQFPRLADVSIISRMHEKSLNEFLANPAERTNANNDGGVPDPTKEKLFYIVRTSEAASTNDPEALDFLSQNSGDTTAVGQTLASRFQPHNRSLAYLAGRTFDFKSFSRTVALKLNYAKTFFQSQVSFGFEVPIVVKINNMKFISELATDDNLILSQEENSTFAKTGHKIQDYFFNRYPKGLVDLYNVLMAEKEMSYERQNSKFGLGDISFYVNRKLKSPNFNYGVVGLGLTVPSSPEPNRVFPWPCELGNGQAWQVFAQAAYFFKQSRLFNPHIFIQPRFSFTTSVNRRVSRLISYDPKDAGANTVAAKDLPLGSTLSFNKLFTNEPESKLPSFADGAPKAVDYRRGMEITARVGNLFDQAFLRWGALDLFYEFYYKFKDNVGRRLDGGDYDLDGLVKNTKALRHTVGAGYRYRWNDRVVVEASCVNDFGGRRTLRNWSVSAACQVKI